MTKLPQMGDPASDLSTEERELGMDCDITRRDFVNAMCFGAGAALLSCAAPGAGQTTTASTTNLPWHPWTGYGGVGDYAGCNGNTWDVVNAAHGIRDHLYGATIRDTTSTGETYDLVIVGGGFAG